MNLDALLHVFYLDVYEFEVYDLFSRPQTRILRGIAVPVVKYNFNFLLGNDFSSFTRQ